MTRPRYTLTAGFQSWLHRDGGLNRATKWVLTNPRVLPVLVFPIVDTSHPQIFVAPSSMGRMLDFQSGESGSSPDEATKFYRGRQSGSSHQPFKLDISGFKTRPRCQYMGELLRFDTGKRVCTSSKPAPTSEAHYWEHPVRDLVGTGHERIYGFYVCRVCGYDFMAVNAEVFR